jgi:hypothetical protein
MFKYLCVELFFDAQCRLLRERLKNKNSWILDIFETWSMVVRGDDMVGIQHFKTIIFNNKKEPIQWISSASYSCFMTFVYCDPIDPLIIWVLCEKMFDARRTCRIRVSPKSPNMHLFLSHFWVNTHCHSTINEVGWGREESRTCPKCFFRVVPYF